MRFVYLCFLVLWTLALFIISVVQTVAVCRLNDNKAIVVNMITLLFLFGILAQFVADGIRVVGG